MRGALAYVGAVILAAAMFAGGGVSGCVFYLNPLCTDQIRNGEETGIDCGGTCGPCAIGSSCGKDTDCEDSFCKSGTCTALPCADGKKGEQETDIDCGGGTCRKCAGGRQCVVDSDCFGPLPGANGTCTPGSNTCASLTTVSFADAVSYDSGPKAYALFAGDLDGDKDLDLAVANEYGNSVSVFLNNGAGTFQSLPAPFTTGDYPTGIAIADFNNDNKLDVVTADYHGDSISVLLGTGMGQLAAKASYPTAKLAETSTLTVGDLNGDGNLDVVATNPSTNPGGEPNPPPGSVSQFLGRGDGTFAPAINLPVGISGAAIPYSAAIGDFDGDRMNDLAIADNRSGTIFVRLGNGDGTFKPEVPYTEGGTRDYILITRDVNLDGNLDLVCANRGSDNVSVLLGRGDGTFKKVILASTGSSNPKDPNAPRSPGAGPYSVAVVDFNLDGVPDVITANFMTGNATVLLGIGDGHFEAPIDAGATGKFSYGVAVGDFNGDGKPDFATANAADSIDSTVTVKLSTSH